MSKLTPFGLALRKLRLERNLRLLDLANAVELSAAFLSAVETGKKGIPDGFVTRLSRSLDLSAAEVAELGKAKDRTRKEVRVGNRNEEQRELIAAFARRLDELPDSFIADLKRRILKSCASEQPFERKRAGFVVPPRRTSELRALAEKVRSKFCPDEQVEFPIIDALEFLMPAVDADYVFRVADHSELGHDEGQVPVGGCELVLREDVYERACRGNGRDRFTAAHELAHYLLHRNLGFARNREEHHKIFQDSEWQADVFAGTLLMSARHAPAFDNYVDMADACLVSHSASKVMYNKYLEEGVIRR